MSKQENAKWPKGVNVKITDTDQIIIQFDRGDIPNIGLSEHGAMELGSMLASQADRAGYGNIDNE